MDQPTIHIECGSDLRFLLRLFERIVEREDFKAERLEVGTKLGNRTAAVGIETFVSGSVSPVIVKPASSDSDASISPVVAPSVSLIDGAAPRTAKPLATVDVTAPTGSDGINASGVAVANDTETPAIALVKPTSKVSSDGEAGSATDAQATDALAAEALEATEGAFPTVADAIEAGLASVTPSGLDSKCAATPSVDSVRKPGLQSASKAPLAMHMQAPGTTKPSAVTPSGIEKKTKCLFYFMLDEALQPSRLFRRWHTERSR